MADEKYSRSVMTAFRSADKIKSDAAKELAGLYTLAASELSDIVDAYFRNNTVITSRLLDDIDEWSSQVAKERNLILQKHAAAAAIATDKMIAGVAQEQWGFVPTALKAPTSIRDAQILNLVKRMFSRAPGADMNALSKNWFKWGFSHKNGRKLLLRQLAFGAQNGQHAIELGKQLFKNNLIQPGKFPKYLDELTRLAKDARRYGYQDFNAAMQKAKAHVSKLGKSHIQYLGAGKGQDVRVTTRAFKNKFLRDLERYVETGSKATLRKAVTRYAQKQAEYNAITLQRSTTNAVMQMRTVERFKDKDYIEGYEWLLAPVRAFTDVCDDYAGQIFKPGNVPAYPHYNCACTLLPVLVPVEKYYESRGQSAQAAAVRAAA